MLYLRSIQANVHVSFWKLQVICTGGENLEDLHAVKVGIVRLPHQCLLPMCGLIKATEAISLYSILKIQMTLIDAPDKAPKPMTKMRIYLF